MNELNNFNILSKFKLVGLSTDSKPTNVKNGSLFLEVDTSKTYIFYKGTWYEITISGSGGSSDEELILIEDSTINMWELDSGNYILMEGATIYYHDGEGNILSISSSAGFVYIYVKKFTAEIYETEAVAIEYLINNGIEGLFYRGMEFYAENEYLGDIKRLITEDELNNTLGDINALLSAI